MYHIFRSISSDFFFKNFTVVAYIAVRLMCGRFQKNHALHTACCGLPRSALDHNQLTHSTPQSLTVSAAVWPPLPRPPSLSLCVCVVSHSNGSQLHCSTWRPSTARTGRAWENSRLKSCAGHAALAPGGSSDITISDCVTSIASCRSFANLLITCMHSKTFLRARK